MLKMGIAEGACGTNERVGITWAHKLNMGMGDSEISSQNQSRQTKSAVCNPGVVAHS